jgi:DNA/RNA-binding domain of Phe-tRNA-synthetase-like protein
MRDLRVEAERAVFAVTRPWIAEWEVVALAELRTSLRAAALSRGAALRGAYRDLAPHAVPGVKDCAELHSALGCDRHQSRLAADVLVARVLRSAAAAEPDPGCELAVASALELLVPIAIDRPLERDGLNTIRFGREDEWIDIAPRGDHARMPLRGRVALFDRQGPRAVPGVVSAAWRGDSSPGSLRIVAFPSGGVADEDTDRRFRSVVTRLMRQPPDASGFASRAAECAHE